MSNKLATRLGCWRVWNKILCVTSTIIHLYSWIKYLHTLQSHKSSWQLVFCVFCQASVALRPNKSCYCCSSLSCWPLLRRLMTAPVPAQLIHRWISITVSSILPSFNYFVLGYFNCNCQWSVIKWLCDGLQRTKSKVRLSRDVCSTKRLRLCPWRAVLSFRDLRLQSSSRSS